MIDASWHMPTTARKGDAEFRAGHIPGSVFFNIDTVADAFDRPAAHAARRRRFRPRDGRAGSRRRHAFRHLRFARPVRCGASLVGVAGLWRGRGQDPCRRPAEMDERRPGAGGWRSPTDAGDVHAPARSRRRRRSRRGQGGARQRRRAGRWTPGPPSASRAVRRSREPA